MSSYWSSGGSRSRGVAILVKQTEFLRVVSFEHDYTGNLLRVTISFENREYILICAYLPCIYASKVEVIQDLRSWIPQGRSVILGGDFNFVDSLTLDRRGSSCPTRVQGKLQFDTLKNQFDLVDIFRYRYPDKQAFSFNRNDISSRLDRFYVRSSDASIIQDISYSPCFFSDHDFVKMDLTSSGDSAPKGKGYWKLNNSLLKKPDICENIRDFITSFDFGDNMF